MEVYTTAPVSKPFEGVRDEESRKAASSSLPGIVIYLPPHVARSSPRGNIENIKEQRERERAQAGHTDHTVWRKNGRKGRSMNKKQKNLRYIPWDGAERSPGAMFTPKRAGTPST